MTDKPRRIVLAAPGYGHQTAAAGRGIWRACRDMSSVTVPHLNSSLLAANFNNLWCVALNQAESGDGVDYFAMIHSDIGPDDFWLDTLIEELESQKLDVLGVAVPIKDQRGLTSLAIDGDGTWRPKCRITMKEVASLPETFTCDDVGGSLLLNTGCWVCKFDLEWCRKVYFTINDRIVFNKANNRYQAECEPEDWFFSRLLHEQGLKLGATRKIRLMHRGEIDFSNQLHWGKKFDDEYGLTESVIPKQTFPFDVLGWLAKDEGDELSELCCGKDVLEIGSYCGRSSIRIAQTAKSLVCSDYFDGRGTAEPRDTRSDFWRNVTEYGVADKITEHNPDDELPVGAFDVVFIDADHSKDAVASDIEKAMAALKPGGLLAFHDYQSQLDPGVTEAVDEFIAKGGELLKHVNTLAVVRPPVPVLSKGR